MVLESLRVRHLNDQAMRKEKEKMVEVAYHQLIQNGELKLKWQECFTSEDLVQKEVMYN